MGKADAKKLQLTPSHQEPAVLPIQQKYYVSILAFTAVLCALVHGHVTNIGWFPRHVIPSLQTTFEHIIVVRVFLDTVGNIICPR